MWEVFFFKNNAENDVGRLIPGLFLFFKKALYKVKANDQHLIYFGRPRLGHEIKNKFYNISIWQGSEHSSKISLDLLFTYLSSVI